MAEREEEWNEELVWRLADELGRTYAAISSLGSEINAESPVSDPELVALIVLDSFPDGLTQTAWGKYQAVSRQRTHVLSKRLCDAGMVDVMPQGRSVLVTLTEPGKALVAENRKRFTVRMASVLTDISPQQGEAAIKTLIALSRALEQGR